MYSSFHFIRKLIFVVWINWYSQFHRRNTFLFRATWTDEILWLRTGNFRRFCVNWSQIHHLLQSGSRLVAYYCRLLERYLISSDTAKVYRFRWNNFYSNSKMCYCASIVVYNQTMRLHETFKSHNMFKYSRKSSHQQLFQETWKTIFLLSVGAKCAISQNRLIGQHMQHFAHRPQCTDSLNSNFAIF